jgi:hypothetical protein
MEPVLPSSSRVTEKTLLQAENLLQYLAERISKVPKSESMGIEKQRNKLLEILNDDKAKQRSQSDWKIKQTFKAINDLKAKQKELNEAMETEISSLLGKEEPDMMSLGKILTWKRSEDSRLDGIYLDTEHKLTKYSSELDQYIVQLNHVQLELQSSSHDLTNLIR